MEQPQSAAIGQAFCGRSVAHFAVSPQNAGMSKKRPATSAPSPPVTIDDFDRRVLALYQSNTRTNAQKIADKLGLSAAAIQRRLMRLRETGVIVAEVAHIDPATLGLPVTVVAHEDIERETLVHIDAFKAAMRARPEAQQRWYSTGIANFSLAVGVASMGAYEQFTREALVSVANVARFTSDVVLDEVKSGLALALSR